MMKDNELIDCNEFMIIEKLNYVIKRVLGKKQYFQKYKRQVLNKYLEIFFVVVYKEVCKLVGDVVDDNQDLVVLNKLINF